MKNVIKVNCSSEDRFRKVLKLLSTLMPEPLSDKEIDVVNVLHKEGGVVTTASRKIVREQLNISVEYLNNYIGRLREKNIIIEDRLHKSLSALELSDESKPYMLLFTFQKNEPKTVSNRGSGQKAKRK